MGVEEAFQTSLLQTNLCKTMTKKWTTSLHLPPILRNRPPGLESITNEYEKFKFDVESRPDTVSLEAYDRIPTEGYGEALLRGMGWKPGTPIGLNSKEVVPVKLYVPRPIRLGLGATPKEPEPKQRPKGWIPKPGESRDPAPIMVLPRGADGKVRHVRDIDEQLVPLKGPFYDGAPVFVKKGEHEGMRGVVVEQRDNGSTALVRLHNDENLVIPLENLHQIDGHVELEDAVHEQQMDQEKPENEKKNELWEEKRDNDDSGHRSSDDHRHDKHSDRADDNDRKHKRSRKSDDSDIDNDSSDSNNDKKRKHSKKRKRDSDDEDDSDRKHKHKKHKDKKDKHSKSSKSSSSSSSTEELWVRPSIHVKIRNKSLKGGLFYSKRAWIIDILPGGKCALQLDGTGEILEGIRQSDLETVVPKETEKVIIVCGKWKGEFGRVVEREDKVNKVHVQLDSTLDMVTLTLDDVAEFGANN